MSPSWTLPYRRDLMKIKRDTGSRSENGLMFKHFLLATDGGAASAKDAVDLAREQAAVPTVVSVTVKLAALSPVPVLIVH